MESGIKPYFPETLEQLGNGIKKNISTFEGLIAEYRKAIKQMDSMVLKMKPCPFCGGQMVNITGILKIDVISPFEGNRNLNLLRSMESFGHYFIPKEYECQKCFAFDVEPPHPKSRYLRQAGKNGFGIVLKKFIQDIRTIEYFSNAYECGWLVKIEDTSYFLRGSQVRIKKSLGLQ